MTIVDADAVAANATAIAIWLMSCARLDVLRLGWGVNVTWGIVWSS